MTGRFYGRTAIVTGSGQSIGRSIALLLAREGANVVVNSRSERSRDDTPTAADTLREITEAGGRAMAAFADVGTMAGARAVIDTARKAFGGVDILVNNAGAGAPVKDIESLTEEEWDGVLAANLKSQYACTALALPLMKRAGSGRIITIGSSVGLFGLAQMAPYAAAKGGVLGLTQALAHELIGSGITVNCVLPSAATTRNNRDRAEREKMTGLSVKVSPERVPDAVAPLVAWLASDAAADMTGQVFGIGGGTIRHHHWPPVETVLVKQGTWSLEELEETLPRAIGTHFRATMPR